MENKESSITQYKWSIKFKIKILVAHAVMFYVSYLSSVWADEEQDPNIRVLMALFSQASLVVCMISSFIFISFLLFSSPTKLNEKVSEASVTKQNPEREE